MIFQAYASLTYSMAICEKQVIPFAPPLMDACNSNLNYKNMWKRGFSMHAHKLLMLCSNIMNASDFEDDNMEISISSFQTSYHSIPLNPMFSQMVYFGMKSNPIIHDFYFLGKFTEAATLPCLMVYCSDMLKQSWGSLNIKMSFYQYRSWDRLIFNMGIPYLGKTVFILRRALKTALVPVNKSWVKSA